MPIYALFLTAILLIILSLNHYYKFHLFSMKWAGILAGFGVISLPFILWDIIATRDGHWAFNEKFILGPKIFGLPIEELLFFFMVPVVMLVVWYLVRLRVKERRIDVSMFYRPILVILGFSTFMTIHRPYTFIVLAVATLFWYIAGRTDYFNSYRFFVFQFWLLLLFFLSNTLLTWPPVVTYGEGAIMGLRIGTIPIEDFLYNFVLINGFILTYMKTERLKN